MRICGMGLGFDEGANKATHHRFTSVDKHRAEMHLSELGSISTRRVFTLERNTQGQGS